MKKLNKSDTVYDRKTCKKIKNISSDDNWQYILISTVHPEKPTQLRAKSLADFRSIFCLTSSEYLYLY